LPQAADAGLAALPAPAASPAGVVHIRPTTQTLSKQHLPNLPGISRATGATGIAMKLVVVPPGAAATPHLHRGFETAIYCLSGRIETRYGPGLRQSVISEPGDFLFIPADVPHQPVNLSATEPAMAVVARNDADEEEHVVLYDPAAD
jgi:uncharacterized RmlC-like cupin family protein